MAQTETTTERLARLGYGHRRDEQSPNDFRHVVFALANGEEAGRFDCLEANSFCDTVEAK